MHEQDKINCTRCDVEYDRPAALKTSMFQQCGFVCDQCRCRDCGIVLQVECECGILHAEPSQEDPQVCVECQGIRARVAVLGFEALQLRFKDFSEEEPIYGVGLRKTVVQ